MNVPKIRFNGFSDEWTQRMLGDITSSYSGGTPLSSNTKYYGGDIPFIRSGEIYQDCTELFITENGYMNSSAKKVNKGDVLYALYGATSGEVAISRINGAINQAILAIKSNEHSDNYFLCQWLKREKSNIIDKYIQGGQGNLSGSIIKSLHITVPSHQEQTKIGELFKTLDELIELKQSKLEITKELKKTMLSKMFPKEGYTTPEIRFNVFNDEWEQHELKKFSSVITKGTTPIDKTSRGDVNFIKIENIDPSSGEITTTSKITNEEHSNYLKRSQLKENDILFSIAGTLGRITSVNNDILPANTNQALAIIRLENGDLEYIKTYLKGRAVSEFIKKNPTVGAQPNLSLEQVSKLGIKYPKQEEQTKIGEYFKNLDEMITSQQKELEALKETKLVLLKKLFV